jgi:type I restriction enzyme S subunit
MVIGCLPEFVNAFLNSVYGRSCVASVVSQQVGQANVIGTKLQALTIPLPPLAEQEQIVAEVERRLSVLAEMEAQVGADLKRAERLRQSILKQAFAGKLVAQDPEDEPAGVLLERVRGQRRAGTDTGRPERALQLRLV